MEVLLRPELEKFIASKVAAGHYASPSDLINEALEILRENEESTPEYEEYVRVEVQRGLDDLQQGRYAEFNAQTIIDEERQRLSEGGRG